MIDAETYQPPEVFSPTSLLLHVKCPMKWYYKKILHQEGVDIDETHLIFGRVTHSVLEKFYDRIDLEAALKNPKAHFSAISRALCEECWDYTLPEKKYSELVKIMELFVDNQTDSFKNLLQNNALENFMPLVVEDDITSETYGIRCIIDRINQNFTFGDYKTTKKFPDVLLYERDSLSPEKQIEYDELRLQYVVQAMMNALCIHDKYGTMPTMCVFIFLRHLNNKQHGGLLQIPITQEDIDFVANLNNNSVEMIESNQYPMTKDLNFCNAYGGCEYKTYCSLNGVCLSTF